LPSQLKSSQLKRAQFGFFVLSGFSGLVYQIVWVRMALASFGVITPFASVVVSVFMLGLALGTWLGGRWVTPLCNRLGVSPIALYGAAELVIGTSAFILPLLFGVGRALLLPIDSMQSGTYLALSSLVITLAMLPWCICMGVTFPTMMAFIRGLESEGAGRVEGKGEPGREAQASFSFLYLANVIGAMLGAIATSVVLIELLGFTRTLWVAAAMNGVICVGSLALARRFGPPKAVDDTDPEQPPREAERSIDIGHGLATGILLLTGFASMALEIVWMRAFTPILGTLVYAFSGLLTVYLFATWLGSALYRRHLTRGRSGDSNTGIEVRWLVCIAAAMVLLPLIITVSSNLQELTRFVTPILRNVFEVKGGTVMIALTLLSILPFCATLGYLTPMLIDHESRGRPESAGRVYAINITGSILGPLAAAYWLLPWVGARLSMALLALPFALLPALPALRPRSGRERMAFAGIGIFVVGALLQASVFGRSFEEGSHVPNAVVRRDHTATVISYGQGFGRHLLVNGYGMTVLTPLTKVMAHLPLVSLGHEPKSALVIAFGMGTTFRSLLSWNIDATAVELVPSVVDAFEYYHDDAEAVRSNPRAHLVIDDGRRFLARTKQRFDLITIDPPPPVETAGSSLLYAREFYAIAKPRLAEGGILQQWFPDGVLVEPAIRYAVLRPILDAFPHVRVFQSLHGQGLHILCSMRPIEVPDVDDFIARMPPSARRDMMEWPKPGETLRTFLLTNVLNKEIPLERLIRAGDGPLITDDRPFNEYFLMRRHILH
jgi:spermidine synthase